MSLTTANKFPSPPSSNSNERDDSFLIRERYFSPRANIADILGALHDSSATGTLTLNLNQGSVASVSFQEKKKINFDTI
jgi:hypothetical protein